MRKLLFLSYLVFLCLGFHSAHAENGSTHTLQKVAKVIDVQEKSSGEFREQLVKLEFDNDGKKEQIFINNKLGGGREKEEKHRRGRDKVRFLGHSRC